MKIDLAVYTAQEGYSWQPGTVLTNERLREYKTCIGKFPSPDDPAFPIGGIFLKDEALVCYRYHVAKKIDFRGRDALYCVLGVIPKAEADAVDPLALLALPQFAAPMIPFPTSAELPAAEPEKVPEWLKNLGEDTLDVRITGTAEKPDFAVVRKTVEKPVKDLEVKPVVDETRVAPEPTTRPLLQSEGADFAVSGKVPVVPEPLPLRRLDRRTLIRLALLGLIAGLAAAVLLLVAHALYSVVSDRFARHETSQTPQDGEAVVAVVEVAGQTNSVVNEVESRQENQK